MAYLNEFPHTEASKLNLDWILEQYSTFNQRLQEIVQHFDESVAQMEGDILQFKGEYEQAFDEYKSQVTHLIEDFETQVQQESYNVERTLETITNNMTTYVGENMSQWQIASSRATIPLNGHLGQFTVPNVHATGHDIILYDYFWATRHPETDELIRNYGSMEDLRVIITDDDEFMITITAPVQSATCYVHYSII